MDNGMVESVQAGAEPGSVAALSVDDFQALEGKVLQAVEMILREREALHAMEQDRNEARAELAVLHERLASIEEAHSTAQTELAVYQQERESMRGRVDRLLRTVDELLEEHETKR